MITRLSKWRSLRVRLSLLVSVTVAVVLAVFLWTTRRAIEETTLAAGAARAMIAAEQVSDLLAQGAVRGGAEARRIAGDPAIRDLLLGGSKDPAAARQLLTPLVSATQPPVEIRDRQGAVVLEAGGADDESGPFPARPAGQTPEAGLSAFRLDDDVITYELVAHVYAAPDPQPAGAPLGSIVVRRTLNGAQNPDAVRRLVGAGASVLVGNQRDGVWTDLSSVAAAPGVDASRDGIAEYRDSSRTDWIGAIKRIPTTPWAVWVGFPRHVVLEPAQTVFRRMSFLATVLVVITAAIIATLSRRWTGPLQELTQASEAIAAGDLDRRVRADRQDEIGRLGKAFNAMVAQVAEANRTLEGRVRERTEGLQRVNDELEAFTYSVSHDLRAPLRHVVGFSGLLQKSAAAMGPAEQRHIATIVAAASRMSTMIDDLLAFSRVGRTALNVSTVDLQQIVQEAQREVGDDSGQVVWTIGKLPTVLADRALLRLVIINLVSNALKYSARRTPPEIEIGVVPDPGTDTFFVRDNGVGFDMAYVDKLFGVFQRLHGQDEFPGVGIGLANVRRIIERHGGKTWAVGEVDRGATFFVSLPRTHGGAPPRSA